MVSRVCGCVCASGLFLTSYQHGSVRVSLRNLDLVPTRWPARAVAASLHGRAAARVRGGMNVSETTGRCPQPFIAPGARVQASRPVGAAGARVFAAHCHARQ